MAQRGWRRGDILVEADGDSVRLAHRRLDPAAGKALVVARDSPCLDILDFLAEWRTDAALTERFAGLDLLGLMTVLSEAGLVFRSEAVEEAFLVRRQAIAVLAAASKIAQDVLGFGPALFEGARQEDGRAAAADLAEAARRLAAVGEALAAARPSHLAEGIAALRPLPPHGSLCLNLGSGRKRIPGWVNIDAVGGDLTMNLRWPLPFADGSAAFVYSAHVLEHFDPEEAVALLAEVHRVLAPGGVVRLVVPDIGALADACARRDAAFFAERATLVPASAPGLPPLAETIAYGGAGTPATDLGGHRFGYDFDTLAALLRRAGFATVERSRFDASPHAALRLDGLSGPARLAVGGTPLSLFVEATR